MKTVAVLSRKGGAGKTTVAVSLAVAAQQLGLKAVLADIDPLRSAGVILWRREDSASLLVETRADKLRVVQDLCRRQRCDLLIIDTPPAPENDVVKAIDLADLCLAVARPSALDLAALDETIGLVLRRKRQGMVVLNQCPPPRAGAEAALTRSAMERLEFAKLPLARAKLRSRVAYQHASSEHRSVTEWSPASQAAAELFRLLGEIGEQVFYNRPFEDPRTAPAYRAAMGPGSTDFAEEPWSTSVPGILGATSGGLWGGGLDFG